MAVICYRGRIVIGTGSVNSFFARMLMEEHLGRSLSRNEVVHHIDENPLNDELGNLQVMTRAEHTSLHRTGKPRSSPMKGKHHSQETKEKMRTSYERTMRLKKEGII